MFRRSSSLSFLFLATGLFVGAQSSAGCSSEPDNFNIVGVVASTGAGDGSGGSGAGGSGGAAPSDDQAKALFAAIEDDLVQSCGSCHVIAGIADTPFMGDPENQNPTPYDAITAWPGIIVKDPSTSVLLTWPAGGLHSGGTTDATLEQGITDWLVEEAKAVEDVSGTTDPTIPPLKPFVPGFNAVYLDPLGADYLGMAITFQAEQLTDSTLSLTNIEVHPTAQKGVKMTHPVFAVYAPGDPMGDPDPGDSFSNVDQDFEAGSKAELGPGTVILTNWTEGGKLSIAFESLSVIDPQGGAGGGGGNSGTGGACNALNSFITNAKPLLQNNCTGCHGGNNQTATNAVDMSDLDTDDDATCGQVKNRVNLDNPGASQLFITTDPNGGASHPFKFGSNVDNFNNFVDSVSVWIQAE